MAGHGSGQVVAFEIAGVVSEFLHNLMVSNHNIYKEAYIILLDYALSSIKEKSEKTLCTPFCYNWYRSYVSQRLHPFPPFAMSNQQPMRIVDQSTLDTNIGNVCYAMVQ